MGYGFSLTQRNVQREHSPVNDANAQTVKYSVSPGGLPRTREGHPRRLSTLLGELGFRKLVVDLQAQEVGDESFRIIRGDNLKPFRGCVF